jgi:hypothetical protein
VVKGNLAALAAWRSSGRLHLPALLVDRPAHAVYEHFIAGPFLRESGPEDDLTYFGAWVSFAF